MKNGWAFLKGDFPGLVHRTSSAACPEEPLPGDCLRDEDCGAGKACACGGPDGFGFVNRCIPAECRSDAECATGLCLLSLGSKPGDCCSYGNLGLFCERPTSTCDEYCTGNGNACIYTAERDRFECQPYPCLCH